MKLKLTLLINFAFITLNSASVYASFGGSGGGSGGSAPFDLNTFIVASVIVGVCAIVLFGIATLVNILVLSTTFLLKMGSVIRIFTPIAWILFVLSILPPSIISLMLYEKNDYSYEALFLICSMLMVSFVYFYIVNIILGIFSIKPFGLYLFRVFIVITVIGVGVGVYMGAVFPLLMLIISTIMALLAYKYYKKISKRRKPPTP